MNFINITADPSTLDFTDITTPTGYLVYSTTAFRTLARRIPANAIALEIGSSYGVATNILSTRTPHLAGIETSKECVASARSRYPSIRFEKLDIIAHPNMCNEIWASLKVSAPPSSPTIVFVDIGGNRESLACGKVLSFVEKVLKPSIIICKSQELVKSADKTTHCVCVTSAATPSTATTPAKKKKIHPLNQPERTYNGQFICRYENYDPRGCFRFHDPAGRGVGCDLVHDVCHACLLPGHLALNCPNPASASL